MGKVNSTSIDRFPEMARVQLCLMDMLYVVSSTTPTYLHTRRIMDSLEESMKIEVDEKRYLHSCRTAKVSPSKKQIVSAIFNSECVVLIVFLPQEEHFTKRFFEDVVIEYFVSKVKIPKTSDKNSKVEFHCDNPRTRLICEKLQWLNVPRLVHLPYSPDLAPYATSSCFDT